MPRVRVRLPLVASENVNINEYENESDGGILLFYVAEQIPSHSSSQPLAASFSNSTLYSSVSMSMFF